MWEPGTRTAYHGVTFGWVLGELIRRIDGRDFASFFRSEICEPLGVKDLYFGITDAEESRVLEVLAPDEEDAARNPYLSTFSYLNEPRIRRAIIPAMGGIGNARSLARVYALLAQGGTLDGVTLFSPERIETMRELHVDAVDDILRLPTQRALGFLLPGSTGVGLMGAGPAAFGHTGIGGTVGFADPEHRLAFALTKNKMETSMGRRSTGAQVYKVLAEALGIARDESALPHS
jgi:CubicO group peptidase (beta-lactamase class C family)